MKSQLQMFRERVEQASKAPSAAGAGPRATTFCITSGKGGVGKTFFSVNFAISLAERGYKVVVIDGDFGFSNVNVLLGKNSPYTLEHVLRKEKTLREVMAESFPNVWYISGGSGVSELIMLSGPELGGILGQLAELEQEMDYIIFDTGAGINDNILRMIDASDRTILVTTPEPTSVLDSYVVLKTSQELSERPEISVLVNKAGNEKEAQAIYQSLASVAQQSLGCTVRQLGYIPADTKITKSIKAMIPYIVQYPMSSTTVQFRKIAEEITYPRRTGEEKQKSGGIRGFFQRLVRRDSGR